MLLVILHYLILSQEQGSNEWEAQIRPKMDKFRCMSIYYEIMIMISLM